VAESRSPRSIAARYTRTTLAASRPNGDAAPSLAGAAVAGSGAGLGGVGDGVADAAAGTDAGFALATPGAGDAAPAVVAGPAEAEADAETAGEPECTALETEDAAAGTTRGLTLAEGRGDGAPSGFGVRDGRGAGDSVAEGEGSGNWAGADSAAGIVAATVGEAATATSAPRFPTIESPAPITNPRTTTPIKIGSSGREGPDGGGGRFRVLRGGEPCIAPVV